MTRSLLTFGLLALLLMMLPGCGFYTFGGSVPSHLENIAVPTFENSTAEFGLADDLTETLIEVFIRDNTFKVVDVGQADALLQGTVTRVQDAPNTFTANETVEEYRVTVSVRVRYEDLVKGKVVWEETLSAYGIYPFGGGLAEREAGVEEALEKLTEDIVNKTVSGW